MENLDPKIQQWLDSPISQSDKFYHKNKPGKKFEALGQDGGTMIATTLGSGDKNGDGSDRIRFLISDPDIYKLPEDYVGINPFRANTIQFTSFDLSNIFSNIGINRRRDDFGDEMDKLDIGDFDMVKNPKGDRGTVEVPRMSLNPYFIIDGEKVFYQRGYVWNLEQKQALIETVYRGLECGRLIVHRKDYYDQVKKYKAGFTDYASYDIVDGKQRLSTLISFCRNEFTDAYGNYWKDLSKQAQRLFMGYRGLLWGEMSDKSTVQQICDAFLNNSTAGTPVSKEHLSFMQDTKEKLDKKS